MVVIETSDEDTDDSWKENTGEINLSAIEVSGAGVSVSDNVVTITAGGDFTITGELGDGQIVVDTDDKVKLRLSGMSLTNKSGSAIYIKNADKAYITLTEGTENHLADGEEYVSGDENEKACITSRDNLEIKGNGMLTVTGNYNHGIFCADSLEIGNGNEMPWGFGGGRTGGTNPENNFTDGGNMQPSRAMPEGEKPQGGRGGAGRSSEISTEHHIQINGGTIYIDAKNDGIDSNGSVVIDGGRITVERPASASGGEMGIDTNSAFIINGGEILSSGTSISETGANQNSVNINFSESIEAGSEFQIRNGSGSIIAALTTAAPFYSMLYSSENLCEGETYHIYVNNTEKASFTVSGKVTTVGTAAGGMGGFGKGGRTRQQLEQLQSRVEI